MTVVLRIKRASGSTDVHELPATGDYVLVPRGLLSAEDILGFDVELADPDRRGSGVLQAGSDGSVTGHARTALD